MPAPARQVALDVLIRVEQEGAFAPLALEAVGRRRNLAPRDRRLATELVYGVLRWQGRLDYLLASFSSRPWHKLSAVVRGALRLAAYQALFLDSVPAAVAGSESVALVKRREPWAAGFVNAVWWAFVRGYREVAFPDQTRDPDGFIAAWHSHPRWLVERWRARWGAEGCAALCEANNAAPPTTLRVNITRTEPQRLAERLAQRVAHVERGRLCPTALLLRGSGPIEALPGFGEGHFLVQDESSQLVAWVVAPRPGERIADLCAAPGGKSTHLAEQLLAAAEGESRDEGAIFAFDVHPRRMGLIAQNARRLGVQHLLRLQVADAARLDPGEVGQFDKVLLDAPCSGTGVLRRRPDLRWQRRPEEMPALVEAQRRLLERAAALVAPGGVLVYATCSVEPEENEENARWFLRTHPDFRPSPLAPYLPAPARERIDASRFALEGSALQLLPHLDGCDGFFIFRAVHSPGR